MGTFPGLSLYAFSVLTQFNSRIGKLRRKNSFTFVKDFQASDKSLIFLCGGNLLFIFGEVSTGNVLGSWRRRENDLPSGELMQTMSRLGGKYKTSKRTDVAT